MSFELSYQEVEELLERVVNNRKLVEVDSENGPQFVVFSFPTANEILISRYIRERALLAATKEELPSREDIERTIEERGMIDTDKIKELEAKIKAQERLLALTKIEARRKPIKDTIDRYSEEIWTLQAQANQMYALTREYRADEESLLYLAWASTQTMEGEKYWKDFQAFEDETDIAIRTSVIDKYSDFNRGSSTQEVRFLARHVLWRIRYTAGLKLGGSLFIRELSDLTPDQQSLLYWSNYYQSIYEMLPDDQPDDDVINDDESLDNYMEVYFKQREQERNQGRLKRRSGGKGKLSADSSDEVIVTTNHPDYLQMTYSDKRVKSDAAAEVEVIAPNSRRARGRRAAARNRRS
jgi:hypothetical protein